MSSDSFQLELDPRDEVREMLRRKRVRRRLIRKGWILVGLALVTMLTVVTLLALVSTIEFSLRRPG